jgi:acetoin utilization deacetylase AcuC-like enzyme
MTTGIAYSDRFLEHDTGLGHPERADRLRAIVARLRAAHVWDRLKPIDFGPASAADVAELHDAAYIARVEADCRSGVAYIDTPDVPVCGASFGVALLAVGAARAAVDAVMAGRVRNAFCAVRPPGHHAERDHAMGFCLFNNIALAAQRLLTRHGLKRVAIVDFDVHHGNGTQHLFEHRDDIFFVSLHEHPTHLYPGTGFGWERGKENGEGFTLNIALDPGSGDDEYRARFHGMLLPALNAYRPEFVLISAGFDAARGDPLAHMKVTPQGYSWMTARLKEVAERHAGGRLVSCLEGGYNLDMLAESVTLHVEALLADEGEDPLMLMKAGL